jgi:6-pyruvoyltetrahydropterin/6-carboxytetrahydropterin synthase
MSYELSREFRFEAGHFLPHVPKSHRCSGIHGHSYRIQVSVQSDILQKTGWVIDFSDIKNAVQKTIDLLDHKLLNEVPGLENPTSENIARFIFDRISKNLPDISSVTVNETPNSFCVYRKKNRSRKDESDKQIIHHEKNLSFNSAHFLILERGKRESIHGHSYNLKINISGDSEEKLIRIMKAAEDVTGSLDSRTLIQGINPFLSIEFKNGQVQIKISRETIVLSEKDVIVLPVENTTSEHVSEYLHKEIASRSGLKIPFMLMLDEGGGNRITFLP